jgi:hypothetical protein
VKGPKLQPAATGLLIALRVLGATSAAAGPGWAGGRSGPATQIERAVVFGGDIYTGSEQGVMGSDMSSLSEVAWLAYPGTSS